MKIAILTPTFNHYSGIDRVVEMQAKEYAKKGNEVTVFALEAAIKPRGFNLEVLGMPKSLFLQRLYRLFFSLDFIKFSKAVNKLKDFDVAISHLYPMNLIASAAKRRFGIKYVYHNHGIGYSELFSNPLERGYMKLFAYLNKLSLNNADSAV
ncbi:glycosyltransferase, partial [Candidatus Woesearchaeota archaeon]|nr:glycosyltransferase [Candidatus Woesearchaeota archaeon]